MNAQELRNLQEAYMEVVENQQLDEAKVEKNLSPSEKENVRNQRAFGSTSSKNRATGMRRTSHEWERGPKEKELPTGNEPTRINPRYDSRVGVRQQLRVAKKRKEERHFAKNAGNTINRFRREETDLYDIILSHLLDEGYAETPEAAEAIMVNMSKEWRESICEAEIEPPRERVGALTNIGIPEDEKKAARERTLAKAKAMREKKKN